MALWVVHFTDDTGVVTVEDDRTGARRRYRAGLSAAMLGRLATTDLPVRIPAFGAWFLRRALAKAGDPFP